MGQGTRHKDIGTLIYLKIIQKYIKSHPPHDSWGNFIIFKETGHATHL